MSYKLIGLKTETFFTNEAYHQISILKHVKVDLLGMKLKIGKRNCAYSALL